MFTRVIAFLRNYSLPQLVLCLTRMTIPAKLCIPLHSLVHEPNYCSAHKLERVSATFVKVETDTIRGLIDCTDLNKGTVKVGFPLPNKANQIAQMAGGDVSISTDAKAAQNCDI